jgi:hypothetical protein
VRLRSSSDQLGWDERTRFRAGPEDGVTIHSVMDWNVAHGR